MPVASVGPESLIVPSAPRYQVWAAFSGAGHDAKPPVNRGSGVPGTAPSAAPSSKSTSIGGSLSKAASASS